MSELQCAPTPEYSRQPLLPTEGHCSRQVWRTTSQHRGKGQTRGQDPEPACIQDDETPPVVSHLLSRADLRFASVNGTLRVAFRHPEYMLVRDLGLVFDLY